MSKKNNSNKSIDLKVLISEDEDFLKLMIRKGIEEFMESEMAEILQAGRSERTCSRTDYRSGYYSRNLVTRVGEIELRVPQKRNGAFSTQIFERYQRSEKAFVAALAEMYVQGVSTRKVKRITECLCGHEFSSSSISRIVKKLDADLDAFANRRLEVEYPYLILDARYERVRMDGVIKSQAVLIAIGVNTDGYRSILAVELAGSESETSWMHFLESLVERGLSGVDLVISDAHPGLRKAITKVLPHALWQRCYVHFLRNVLSYLSKKTDKSCFEELRQLYDRKDLDEAMTDLAVWLVKWQDKCSRLCDFVEENIEETFTFYNFPTKHRIHLRSSNLIERLNQEIKRRTKVVRIFPNAASCLRLIRSLAVEIDEGWLEGQRYLEMKFLVQHKKEDLKSQSKPNPKSAA